MSHPLNTDLLTLQYLEALEAADWETVGELWRLAETHAELESCLLSLSAGLLEEAGSNDPLAQDAEVVRALLRKHFAQRPDPTGPAPLTAGDVAVQLQVDHRQGRIVLSETERQLLSQLQTNPTPLPEQITRDGMDAWATQLRVTGNQHFWREFRRVASLLRMRENQQAMQLAAREEKPRKGDHDS